MYPLHDQTVNIALCGPPISTFAFSEVFCSGTLTVAEVKFSNCKAHNVAFPSSGEIVEDIVRKLENVNQGFKSYIKANQRSLLETA